MKKKKINRTLKTQSNHKFYARRSCFYIIQFYRTLSMLSKKPASYWQWQKVNIITYIIRRQLFSKRPYPSWTQAIMTCHRFLFFIIRKLLLRTLANIMQWFPVVFSTVLNLEYSVSLTEYHPVLECSVYSPI